MKPSLGIQSLRNTLLGLFTSLVLVSPTASATDDTQLWNWIILNLWENDTHRLYTYMDNRVSDDMSEERLWLMSLRYKYKVNPNLQLGLGYTYLDSHNTTTDVWRDQQRLEFELNPSFKLDEWKLHFRNRLELRFYQDSDEASYRFRQRTQLSRPIDLGCFDGFYTNIETFYMPDIDRINEFRTIPVGLGMPLGDQTKLNLFYMIQSQRDGTSSHWTHAHVLGTVLTYSF
ncbi:MAG: DUF2490 domain-containing protein [Akkermansiaceae bacterium]|nr:DUF2490 domain-containing protein [Akkermansiaceae bacterium]